MLLGCTDTTSNSNNLAVLLMAASNVDVDGGSSDGSTTTTARADGAFDETVGSMASSAGLVDGCSQCRGWDTQHH